MKMTKLVKGDRVQLKNTTAVFTVVELFGHFMGLKDGERTYEDWARLETPDGNPAWWKVQQLEKV
jgi:hypothetical protein